MAASVRTLIAHREQLEAQAEKIIEVAEHRLKPVREELERVNEKIMELDAKRMAKEIQQYNRKAGK